VTDVERVKLAGLFGLILATRQGQRPQFIVDDNPSPRTDKAGWKMHYPREPGKLVPKGYK